MAISYVAAGALGTGTITVTPALPAGVADGDLMIAQVATASPDDSYPTTPVGWTLVDTVVSTGGTYGAAAGPRRLTVFVREYVSGDAAPTFTIATGTGVAIAAQIYGYHRSAGTGWRYAVQFGDDAVSDVSFSGVSADDGTWAPNDHVLTMYVIPDSTVSFSAEAITATGITFSALTEVADNAVTDGHDLRFASARGTVTAGTDQQAPTITATLSGASVGAAGVIRMREASAVIATVQQGSVPPRMLITGTGLAAENIDTVTLIRTWGGNSEIVRGADTVALEGDDAFVRTDGENPFGIPFYYTLELIDVLGGVWTVSSSDITLNITNPLLSDALSGLGANVQIASWAQEEYSRSSALYNINGRVIVVSRPRSSPTSTLVVLTSTNEERDSMNALLDNATNGIIQLRQQHNSSACAGLDDDELDAYLAVTEDVFTRNGRFASPSRRIALSCVEVSPWPAIFEARGSILLDIYDTYPTGSLYDIYSDYSAGTLLTLAQVDWTV